MSSYSSCLAANGRLLDGADLGSAADEGGRTFVAARSGVFAVGTTTKGEKTEAGEGSDLRFVRFGGDGKATADVVVLPSPAKNRGSGGVALGAGWLGGAIVTGYDKGRLSVVCPGHGAWVRAPGRGLGGLVVRVGGGSGGEGA